MKTYQQLKDEAWRLYSLLMRINHMDEDGYVKCYTCSRVMKLNMSQGGHFLHRAIYSGLMLHPDNSRPQCEECNIHKNGNINVFEKNLHEEIGDDRVNNLYNIRHSTPAPSRQELIEIIKDLKIKLKSKSTCTK